MKHILIKNLFVACMTVFTAFAGNAALIDDAKRLYNDGQYEAAIPKLRQILRNSPNDGNANYYLGACLYSLGDYEGAWAPLEKAKQRNAIDAPHLMAEIAFSKYKFDDAASLIDDWEANLTRNRRSVPEEEMDALRDKTRIARNMLSRVEQIEFVDSMTVRADDFFKHYVLTDDAGNILPASTLPADKFERAAGMAYNTGNQRQYLWCTLDNDSVKHLMSAFVYPDGSSVDVSELDVNLGDDADVDYPFLCSDGVTFYFASNGEGSLGGYDIFMSRRDAEGNTLQPQNIGMPYNSPANDYMFVIDEGSNLGWWATDRNAPEGMVTIYVFRPSDTRMNYPVDDEDALIGYARLTDVEIPEGGHEIVQAIEHITPLEKSLGQFEMIFPNGTVYRQLNDFTKPAARTAMRQLLEHQQESSRKLEQLNVYRERYAEGDHSVSSNIISLERYFLAEPSILFRLRNAVITAESN